MQVTVERKHGGRFYTQEEILEYLQKPGVVKWLPARELLGGLHDACVDGRTQIPVIANPAGDVAILMEAIMSVGYLIRHRFSELEIKQIFEWYLGEFGNFYMHSDEHGMNNLMKALNADSRIKVELKTIEQVELFIKDPDPKLQIRLLAYLRDPNNIGCGHLKLMMTDPEAYDASRKVIHRLLAAFYDVWWNGPKNLQRKLEYPILKGSHREGGVVVVRIEEEIKDETLLPLIKPTDGEMSIFVIHPQVTEYMHKHVAKALAKSKLVRGMSRNMIEGLQQDMKARLNKEIQTTISRLGWGLPIYNVVLKP